MAISRKMITMDKTRIVTVGALLFMAALMTLSCTSMRMTDKWRDSTFQGQAYKKIMVVAMTSRTGLRQATEGEFSRQLKARGDEAVVCNECIPDVDIDNSSLEKLAKVSAGEGIEAYLIVRVLRTETRIEFHRSSSQPPPSSGVGMDSMMNMQLSGSPDPPMEMRTEVATLEARLFDGRSGKLIWRSTIESVDPSGDGSGVATFVRTVLAALEDEKLIPKSK
jgi:hypothetical protein